MARASATNLVSSSPARASVGHVETREAITQPFLSAGARAAEAARESRGVVAARIGFGVGAQRGK